MTIDAKRPQIPFDVRIDWPFEPLYWSDVIYLCRGGCDFTSTDLAGELVPF
jgi:hypothetical protein